MFEEIPETIQEILTNNDLLVYSMQIVPSKQGPVLRLGAHFPHAKFSWEPLDQEENVSLRKDVKKELRKQGYQAKVKSFVNPYTREKDINDFRLRILLQEGDVDEVHYEKIKLAHLRARREKRRASERQYQHERLSGQL